jgi:hypothetical protein
VSGVHHSLPAWNLNQTPEPGMLPSGLSQSMHASVRTPRTGKVQ